MYMYFKKILAFFSLQFALSKLQVKIDYISTNCLANKLHLEFYLLVYVFCGVIGGILFLICTGCIMKKLVKKWCQKST